MTLEDIDRRLRAIEDIEEVKRLKARYCSYCDDNYDADSIANLFTEDAIFTPALPLLSLQNVVPTLALV